MTRLFSFLLDRNQRKRKCLQQSKNTVRCAPEREPKVMLEPEPEPVPQPQPLQITLRPLKIEIVEPEPEI